MSKAAISFFSMIAGMFLVLRGETALKLSWRFRLWSKCCANRDTNLLPLRRCLMRLKDFEQKSHRFWLAILLAAAYFFLMFGNGMLSLTHPDEVFYVQTVKEMVRHKSWLTTMIFDWPQFEKPIFFYWLLV